MCLLYITSPLSPNHYTLSLHDALPILGPHKIDRSRWDWDEVAKNPFFCPDPVSAKFYEEYLDGIRKSGSSIGAVLEIVDRKSTRLNSSHVSISYAVFCLKKKK